MEAARMMQITFGAMTVTLDIADERAWEVLRFAAGQAGQTLSNNPHIQTVRKGPAAESRSMSARVREVVKHALRDGHAHERRELSRAVRDAGLNVNQVSPVLARMDELDKHEHVGTGRPMYRDTSVPSPFKRETGDGGNGAVVALGSWPACDDGS
jgi:hypothetical protein